MNFTTLTKKFFTIVYARLLLLCVFFSIASAAFGQAPPNDNACQATALIPAANCTYLSGTNVNATASSGSQVPTCANFTSGTTKDVWYKAVVPAGGAVTFDMQGGGITDGGMAVYRGNSCTGLVFLACDDNSSGNANMPKITVTGLAVGSTVYARVWARDNVTGTFGICVSKTNAVAAAGTTTLNHTSPPRNPAHTGAVTPIEKEALAFVKV